MPHFDDIDREIDYLVSPSGTLAPMLMGGAHEASDRYSRELALWAPAIQSADAAVLPDKDAADARSLDILRNDAYVAHGQQIHRDSIVGSMFMLNAKPNFRALGLDETWSKEFQEEVETKFTLWAESGSNWVDAGRRNTFTGLVRLAVGVYVAAGEILSTVEWIRDSSRPYNTAIQMIELNRLSNPGDRRFDTERVRGGIEVDSYGAPIAYFIRRAGLDYNLGFGSDQWRWSRIRATKSRINRRQVLHYLEQGRPGQTRGIGQMVAALKEMRITKRFREITLQNAVVNASFAASIESEMPTAAVFEALGSNNVAEAVENYGTGFLSAVSRYTDSAKNMAIDGVRIPHLYPGTKLNLTPMGHPGGVGQDFEASLLRYIAANLGVSYEELSKDYRETNYSSARAGMLNTWKYMTARKKAIADPFATAIYRLWLEEALGRGEITTMVGRPNWYEGLNADAYSKATWLGAARGMIDELKETQAARLRIDSGLSTYEIELGRQGVDWRDAFAQQAREKSMREDLDIVIVKSNEVNAISGDVREAGSGDAEAPGGKEDA